MSATISGAAAIAGLGITEMTREYTGDAATLALNDAGLEKNDLDGLLTNGGISSMSPYEPGSVGLGLQVAGGFRNLRLMNHMNAAGSTAAQMVHYAALAINAGMTNAVACVFADAPLTPGQSAGGAYGRVRSVSGMAGPGPAYVVGMGQGHPGNPRRAGCENEVNTGAALAKETAFRMAGITTDDVDVCELYDCYTYTMERAQRTDG